MQEPDCSRSSLYSLTRGGSVSSIILQFLSVLPIPLASTVSSRTSVTGDFLIKGNLHGNNEWFKGLQNPRITVVVDRFFLMTSREIF